MEAYVSYNPLWALLGNRELNRTQLARDIGISKSTLAKMGHDELARGARGRLRKAVRDNAELLVGLWDGGMHER